MYQMKPNPLKVERELRGWSQSKVAELLGTTTRTVRRWERGEGVPYPHYREQLCILFGKNAHMLGILPDTDYELDMLPDTDHELDMLPDTDYELDILLDTDEDDLEMPEVDIASEEIPEVDMTSNNLVPFPSSEPTWQRHSSEDHLPSHQSLLDVSPGPTRNVLTPRFFDRFSRRSRLIALLILFVVCIITSNLLAFTLPHFLKSIQLMTMPSAQTPSVISYEAEAPENTRTGQVKGAPCTGCSERHKIGHIGKNSTLQFNNVFKKSAGNYKLTIYYVDGDAGRDLYISVDAGPAIALYAPGTNDGNWKTKVRTLSITVHLKAGNNTIKFYNPVGSTPDLDRIVV